MFVFFLGMNKKKRANQPSQPARLVTETASGSPRPRDWNLFGLHLEAPFSPERYRVPTTPMTLPNLLVESIFNYIVYKERETAEWINLWNTRSFKPWCSNILWRKQNLLFDILFIFDHIWVNECCFWLFLFAKMQFQEIRRALWDVSHHSKFTQIYPLGECCLNVSFSEIQFNYKSQLPVGKLEATSRYNFYWEISEFLGLPVFLETGQPTPPPENVPPQK